MWNQWQLTGRAWDKLRDLVDEGQISLFVPEVVVQEVVRGRKHDANDLVEKLHALNLHRVERLLSLSLPTKRDRLLAHVQSLVVNYETELRNRLNELGAEVIPVPSVSHLQVLNRAMEGRQPFDAEGRNGYRDVLIWHSVLDVASLGCQAVVFVTNNSRDFCIGKPPELAPALKREFEQIAPTAELLIAASVAGAAAPVDHLTRTLPRTYLQPDNDTVEAALNQCAELIVAGGRSPVPGRWGEQLDDGWQFSSLLSEGPIEVESIDLEFGSLSCQPAGDDWEEFTARARATVVLDGFAFKADFYVEDRIRVDVQDRDWNKHYMHVHEYHEAELSFRLVQNETGTAIKECWLEEATEVERHDPPDPD